MSLGGSILLILNGLFLFLGRILRSIFHMLCRLDFGQLGIHDFLHQRILHVHGNVV